MWEPVIGLEIHAELSTSTKIFCGCSTEFGAEPNTLVCPVCSGMPGVLPRLNEAVAVYAVRLGLLLNCSINPNSVFDRKNYIYPDLPKSYQISQLYTPVCTDGKLEITSGGKTKIITIREIHIEEDAGKLIHDPLSGNTLMDFNRCGIPLVEIVTNPDFETAGEVAEFLENLKEILMYADICDCKMQEGSIRADINLSIRQKGGELGVRTEMKNLNSFKAIGRAVESETKRQTEIIESGGKITQETRRWDDNKQKSFSMRSKENANDYRYFPEPDMQPLIISDDMINGIKNTLPELGTQKRERYEKDWHIAKNDAEIITSHKNIATVFEELSEKSGSPSESANLITGEIMRLMNTHSIRPENLKVNCDKLSYLIKLEHSGKINGNSYKKTVAAVFKDNVEPDDYIMKHGLLMNSDNDAVSRAVKKVLSDNSVAADDYRNGKEKAFGFLMGAVMKELRGSGNPEIIRKSLTEILSNGDGRI